MKRLIIHGDPGIRKEAVINYDGAEQVCYSISRQGDWHGPERPQLWCVIGTEDEREDFVKQRYVPHFLDTETIDADDVDIVKRANETAVS